MACLPIRGFNPGGVPADQTVVGNISKSRPGDAKQVREFLALNRRRTHGNPPLGVEELERWLELRLIVDGIINGREGSRPGRRALRVPTHLKVRIDADGRDELGRATDLSEGGIFLATERPLEKGTPIRLKLEGDDGREVEVEGIVAWTRETDPDQAPAGMGVQFECLDDEQSRAIAELMHEALSAL